MANLDLSKYGITGAVEIVHNPSYETLFAEETKESLQGYEKGPVKILFGGLQKNTKTITNLLQPKLGTF